MRIRHLCTPLLLLSFNLSLLQTVKRRYMHTEQQQHVRTLPTPPAAAARPVLSEATRVLTPAYQDVRRLHRRSL